MMVLTVVVLFGALVLSTVWGWLMSSSDRMTDDSIAASNRRVLAELRDIQINRPNHILRDANQEYEDHE